MLADEAHASPLGCFEWFDTALRAEHPSDQCVVGALRDSAGLLAVLPLVRVRLSSLLTRLQPPGAGWLPTLALPLSPRLTHPALLQPLLMQTLSAFRRWDICRLPKLPANIALPIAADLAQPGLGRLRLEHIGDSVLLHPGASRAAFLASVSSAHRKALTRQVNSLNGAFRVEFRSSQNSDPAPLIEDAIAVCRASWQQHARSGRSISHPDALPFFRAVCMELSAVGRLDLSLLYLDGAPVSYIWGARHAAAAGLIKLGFDQRYRDHSPGNVHLLLYLEECAQSGIECVDNGHEFASYKKRWSKLARPLYELRVYRQPVLGRVRAWLHARLAADQRRPAPQPPAVV